MAIQLARKGINVVLVGRSASKLEDVTKEITSKSRAEVKFPTEFLFVMIPNLFRLFQGHDISK